MKRLLTCLPVFGLLLLTGCDATGLDAAAGSTANLDRFQCEDPSPPDCDWDWWGEWTCEDEDGAEYHDCED